MNNFHVALLELLRQRDFASFNKNHFRMTSKSPESDLTFRSLC